jgi:hypothetical protein
MPQESQWQAQAAVLRQALAEHGVELAQPQALKVLSRMRGHPAWQPLAGMPQVALARTDLAAPAQDAPAGAVASARPASRAFVFEARGEVADAAQLAQLEQRVSQRAGLDAAWKALRRQAQELGFSTLMRFEVQPRPSLGRAGQGVAVLIGLAGQNGLTQLGAVPANLGALLEQLAARGCRGPDGRDPVVRYTWKLVAVDEAVRCS